MNWKIGVRFSRLTAIELLASCRSDTERALAQRFISYSTVIDLTDAIASHAFDLLSTIAHPTTLTADDAIIAATAIEHSLPLYTLDPARFTAVPGITTLQPY
jgi:predicted nucleic acid-binding protein